MALIVKRAMRDMVCTKFEVSVRRSDLDLLVKAGRTDGQ